MGDQENPEDCRLLLPALDSSSEIPAESEPGMDGTPSENILEWKKQKTFYNSYYNIYQHLFKWTIQQNSSHGGGVPND